MQQGLRHKALKAMGWTFSQQAVTQAIRFAVSILLARLLAPHDFGILGMVAVVAALSEVLMDGGMASSLVRSENPDEADFASVFFINLLTGTVIYMILFFAAPWLAEFFRQPILSDIIRVYCISVVIHAFSIVQWARLTRQLDFRTQFMVALPSLLAGAITGLACAWYGFGVWSLVWMHLVQTLFNTIQVWIRAGWKPALILDWNKIRTHFSFGYKLTLSALLFRGYKNLVNILIGRYFAADQ
ncbi:MAG: oligosaccharide flippase family protein, partial [Cyclobacteriaceae bacterium]|nr:oligosaccharide flippase family protein [Cyclobacteriaceae bacterium]